MSRRRREEEGSFAELVPDARPLAGRGRVRAPQLPEPVPGAPRREPVPFVLEGEGEARAGRARDVSRRTLARLRRGAWPPEREVDLHGLRAGAAEAALRDALLAARRAGQRCVLAIHGRGRHSDAEPVVRAALAGWLTHPPLDAAVMAFASAPQALGGSGATLVLLRRPR